MKHFHHVFTNIRHATIDQEDDLVKLVASSDTEAGLRQNHVMWLQSRDVAKMTVYRTR
jgi:hypothetical protein